MIKRRITYPDYNGVERTEDFYFGLTKTEISKMEVSTECGLVAMLQRVMDKRDGKTIMHFIESIIHQSYGEKSLDGKKFMKKNGALADEFVETEAYNLLFMELISDPEAAVAFVKGILPDDMRQAVEEEEAKLAKN